MTVFLHQYMDDPDVVFGGESAIFISDHLLKEYRGRWYSDSDFA
jgi:hypothetical protein